MKWRYLWFLTLLPVAALAAVGVLYLAAAGFLSGPEPVGEIRAAAVPEALVEERLRRYRAAPDRAAAAGRGKQILFGDFHVHSTFSFDAFTMSLSILRGDGSHPPADACDFARHCSALDFWAITDHAEWLPAARWRETVDMVRQCNSLAGSKQNPDMHSFLGWEWTQTGQTPDKHYGHRNVVLKHTDEARIPTRPIAARNEERLFSLPAKHHLMAMMALRYEPRMRRFSRHIRDMRATQPCADFLPVRQLEDDCLESTARPAQLFARLREWGHEVLVIPHGATWGIYTPPGSNWRKQLRNGDYDPQYQPLLEVFSGHGNTERYVDFAAVKYDSRGRPECPEASEEYLPSCVRAGQIIEQRCLAAGIAEEKCADHAAIARRHYVEAGLGGHMTVPGARREDWLDSGQCRSCFMPAFNYRPGNSAQYLLALRNFDAPPGRRRVRPGFIASSDVHTARPGTGYKEYGVTSMTEARDYSSLWLAPSADTQAIKSRPVAAEGDILLEGDRLASFFGTGGLVAIHSEDRSREALWAALQRREVYATSGPRMLLWFDLVDHAQQPQAPMGSVVRQRTAPSFRVRAMASLEQQPGCPAAAQRALGEERIERLCGGECYHPSEQRRVLERIEVIRIRPQRHAAEPIAALVEDPWRSYDCQGKAVCEVHFSDPEYPREERSSVYYVRAIEQASAAVNGANVGCERDAEGRCVRVHPCVYDWRSGDDCLAPVEERAWSSPIYVDHPADEAN